MNNEEYEEGYELLKSIKGPMNADEMFEKLGYRKVDGLNDNFVIWYVLKQYSNINRICFNIIDKKIHFELDYDIDMQELQAINKKCEELGWLERN